MRKILNNKKLTLSNIMIDELKSGDFIFLLSPWDDIKDIPLDRLKNELSVFENKLPEGVNYTFLTGISYIKKLKDKDAAKLLIDLAIKRYNEHFNDIYMPYSE